MADSLKIIDAEVRQKLTALGLKSSSAVAKALYAEALLVMGESVDRTPVDTTALRDSHVTTQPQVKGRDIEVKIEVGGSSAPYALIVHEDLEARHDVASGFRGGQAKFLESAVLEAVPNLASRIAMRLRETLL